MILKHINNKILNFMEILRLINSVQIDKCPQNFDKVKMNYESVIICYLNSIILIIIINMFCQ